MARGLNYDNKILAIVNTVVDIVILGIFWFVTSIPIFTIGASTSAVYYTINKCIRNKKSYAYVEYWKAFKSNFKQSTIAWLIWLIPAAFLVADCMLMKQQLKAGAPLGVMYYFFLILAAAALAWAFYLFPYMARFECTVKEALKKSLFMMVANLGWSIVLVAVFLFILFWCRDLMSLFVLFPGGFGAVKNYILEKVFKKYRTPEDIAKELEENRTYAS